MALSSRRARGHTAHGEAVNFSDPAGIAPEQSPHINSRTERTTPHAADNTTKPDIIPGSTEAAPAASPLCVLGGAWVQPSFHGSNTDGGIVTDESYTGIAGDEPDNAIIAECCLPFAVNFLAPCILWCPYDDDAPLGVRGGRGGWIGCLRERGIEPIAEFGQGSQPNPGWRERGLGLPAAYAAVAIAAGLAIAFAVVQRVRVRDGRKMVAAAAAAELWKIRQDEGAGEAEAG
ncbi:hypothetical protein MN608_05513 [Microdochium nivale]|nr:hypothetical protein MN608_05513 [Microdochium nivale]